ncbi:MAG: GerMN domain-containing protein [Smithellaceae bacterium]|nr:GerMN domain-containing protein [Smithellaceae bacterium]
MATKKTLRNMDFKQKKTRKTKKRLHWIIIGIFGIGLLFIFFVMFFDYVFKAGDGTESQARKRVKMAVTVYFSDANERFLVGEKRYIPKVEGPRDQAMEIVKALLDGSKTGLVNSFPRGVPLRDVSVSDDTAIVNLGKDLVKLHPGGSASEMATIYSLTNSLIANIPSIGKVKLIVEGKEIESIRGHMDARQPFAFNKEFIAPVAKAEKKN